MDDILNINTVYFDKMVSQIYPSELQLNKANTSGKEAAFQTSNNIVSTKIYDTRDDFEMVMFLSLHPMESISLNTYGLLRHLVMLLTSMLTQKLLKQGYWYHKLCKTSSKLYRRYYDFISKFQVGLTSLLCQ